jgi:putative transposase
MDDGKGRALDNVMIERLWRTVKYDDIYIRGYERRSAFSSVNSFKLAECA